MCLRIAIVSIFLSYSLFSQEVITLDASLSSGAFINYNGFIHGETNLNATNASVKLLQDLKPNFWRNSDWHQTQKFADSLSCNTTLVISDFYASYKGGYANAKPWLNWNEYELFVQSLMTQYRNAGYSPNYWDVWNEPNDGAYWSGTLSQLAECFMRTRQVADAIDPAIKLVGPSLNYYDPELIRKFLDSLQNRATTLDAVSWHEFGLPDSLDVHVTDFKNKSLAHASWGNPKIHINEYSPQQTNQIPAYRLGWLYHLEQAGVDWANTACWNSSDGTTNWSNCQVGLNGVLSYDEQSTLPVYWVHKIYADMQAGQRIFCNTTSAKTLALASKKSTEQSMTLLAGRFYSIDNGSLLPSDAGKESSNVSIQINNYPYLLNGSVPMLIQKIPKGSLSFQYSPLAAPVEVYSGTATVAGGSIAVNLPSYLDGDAYVVYLNSSEILSIQENRVEKVASIFPNPSTDFIQLTDFKSGEYGVEIFNAMGVLVKKSTIENNQSLIDISTLPDGFYLVKYAEDTIPLIKGL